MAAAQQWASGQTDDGLDPEIRRFVQLMSKRWRQHPPLDQVPVAQARRIAEQVREPWTKAGRRWCVRRS